MSAYVVSDNHINAMVNFTRSKMRYSEKFSFYHDGKSYEFNLNDLLDANKFAQVLIDENYRSIIFRYKGKKEVPHSANFCRDEIVSPVQMLKLISCYEYQACENGDYDKTLASKICHKLRLNAIKFLQGYEEAKWGL
jgi:hypothetical protein